MMNFTVTFFNDFWCCQGSGNCDVIVGGEGRAPPLVLSPSSALPTIIDIAIPVVVVILVIAILVVAILVVAVHIVVE